MRAASDQTAPGPLAWPPTGLTLLLWPVAGQGVAEPVAEELQTQSGVEPVPDARAREGLFGMRWKGELGSLQLRHTRRFERSRCALALLASPHRATTRLTGLDLIPVIGRKTSNLKVVLSFEYRKISSPDPYRPRSSRIFILRLSYEAFKR